MEITEEIAKIVRVSPIDFFEIGPKRDAGYTVKKRFDVTRRFKEREGRGIGSKVIYLHFTQMTA